MVCNGTACVCQAAGKDCINQDDCCDGLSCSNGLCSAGGMSMSPIDGQCTTADDCEDEDDGALCPNGYCCWPVQHDCNTPLDCCGATTDCNTNHLFGSTNVCCIEDQNFGCTTDDDCCGSDTCDFSFDPDNGYCD
jgi:hypothetical protein